MYIHMSRYTPELYTFIDSFQDWAASGDFKDLGLCWHEPSPEETHLCEKILHEFLKPELNMLEEFINKKHTDRLVRNCTYIYLNCVALWFSVHLSRDSLQQSLQLISHILHGAAAYLPMLNGTQVEGW